MMLVLSGRQRLGLGKPLIIHVEPDLWGYLQQRSSNPNNVSAAVASSGYADVAAYPNTVSGFARALGALRVAGGDRR